MTHRFQLFKLETLRKVFLLSLRLISFLANYCTDSIF